MSMTIASKISELTEKLKSERVFANSNLEPDHITIFLLFGFDEAKKKVLEQMVRDLVKHKKVATLLAVDKGQTIEDAVRDTINEAGAAGVNVDDLNKINFCTFVDSKHAHLEDFQVTVDNVEDFRKKSDYEAVWKHFLILDTDSSDANKWLSTLSDAIKKLSFSISGRCCVMTRKNEDNFFVADSRLYGIALVIALLSAVESVKENLGHHIGCGGEDSNKLFFAAQTVVISDPTLTRTWICVIRTLEELLSEIDRSETDIDVSFVKHILKPFYEKLPHIDDFISLLPLYALMNDNKFTPQLNELAKNLYTSPFTTATSAIHDSFRAAFLKAFISSGRPIEYIDSIRTNISVRESLLNSAREQNNISIQSLPELKSKRISTATMYQDVAKSTIEQLYNIPVNILDEFFDSSKFASLPSLYRSVLKELRDMIYHLKEEEARLSVEGLEVRIDFGSDPNDKVVENVVKQLSDCSTIGGTDFAQPGRCIVQTMIELEREQNGTVESEIINFLCEVFDAVRRQIGTWNPKWYMQKLHENCVDVRGAYSKKCVDDVSKQLKLPIRIRDIENSRTTLLWGDCDNNFCAAWSELYKDNCQSLPISSDEHIALLSLSAPFTEQNISGISSSVFESVHSVDSSPTRNISNDFNFNLSDTTIEEEGDSFDFSFY